MIESGIGFHKNVSATQSSEQAASSLSVDTPLSTVICEYQSKTLSATYSNGNKEFFISDKVTGKTEPLKSSKVMFEVQPDSALQSLLSGKSTKLLTKTGENTYFKLAKSSTGWGITQAKESISNKENEISI